MRLKAPGRIITNIPTVKLLKSQWLTIYWCWKYVLRVFKYIKCNWTELYFTFRTSFLFYILISFFLVHIPCTLVSSNWTSILAPRPSSSSSTLSCPPRSSDWASWRDDGQPSGTSKIGIFIQTHGRKKTRRRMQPRKRCRLATFFQPSSASERIGSGRAPVALSRGMNRRPQQWWTLFIELVVLR